MIRTLSRRALVLRTAAAAAIVASIAIVGCDQGGAGSKSGGSAGGGRDAKGGAVFTFVNRGDVNTLDLNRMSYLQDFRIAYAIREGLFNYDPDHDFAPVPALAVESTPSADQRTWTFKLRENAKWTNGDPVVAGDFVFSWRLMLEAPGEYTSLFHYIENAEQYQNALANGGTMDFATVGVSAPDDRTLVVRLKQPVPFIKDLLAFPPFYPRHQKSMEPFRNAEAGARLAYQEAYTRPDNVVTNGPFKLATWEAGNELTLARNDQYWDAGAVKLDRVVMAVVDEPNSALTQYTQGKVHWLADLEADIASRRKQQNDPDLKIVPAFGTAFITVNCAEKVAELGDQKNPLADVRVRRALAMAIDKQYLVDRITLMGERPATSYVPPGFFKGWMSTPAPAMDLAGAQRLLAEAGFPDGKGMPAISVAYNSNNKTRRALAEYLTQQWQRNLGVPVSVKPLEQKMAADYMRSKQYTLSMTAWYGDYMDPSTFTDKYKSNSDNNDSNWAPPEYDALLAKGVDEIDPTKRFELLMRAEAMINTELPIIPLYYYTNLTMQKDVVEGLTPNAKNLIVWKQVGLRK